MEARRELYVRALALPLALIGGRVATAQMPGAVRMLSMWVHETGHAMAAWVTGFAAFPGPWFTPVDNNRSIVVTVLLAGALGAGAYRAWLIERWFWVVAAVAGLVLALFGAFVLHPLHARQLIVFGGDGGCFVLGSVLMLTMYARPGHPMRRDHLRWACLVFGALAFMDARASWLGNVDAVPLGEDDRGLSDPSVLTELYGWTLPLLIGRYTRLATACLVVLGAVWVAGLAAQLRDVREAATSSSPSSLPRSRRTASTR